MIRSLMLSSTICDCTNRYEDRLLESVAGAGIQMFSSLIAICRPRFCRYPFKCITTKNGPVYDLQQYDDLWWSHLDKLIEKANKYGLGIQFDFLSRPTMAKGEFMYLPNNVQDIKPSVSLCDNKPAGEWMMVLDNLCAKLTPYINAVEGPVAVLPVLEGSGSFGCECFIQRRLWTRGLHSRIFITNDHCPGMIHSAHPGSVNGILRLPSGSYSSTDNNKHIFTGEEMKRIVAARLKKEDKAIEYYNPFFSADRVGGAYLARHRPS